MEADEMQSSPKRILSEDLYSRPHAGARTGVTVQSQSLSALESNARSVSVVNDTLFACAFVPQMSEQTHNIVQDLLAFDAHDDHGYGVPDFDMDAGRSCQSVVQVNTLANAQTTPNRRGSGRPMSSGYGRTPVRRNVDTFSYSTPTRGKSRSLLPSSPDAADDEADETDDVFYRPSPWKINPMSHSSHASDITSDDSEHGKITCRIGTPISAPPPDMLEEYKM
jgi:hypothetical protein